MNGCMPAILRNNSLRPRCGLHTVIDDFLVQRASPLFQYPVIHSCIRLLSKISLWGVLSVIPYETAIEMKAAFLSTPEEVLKHFQVTEQDGLSGEQVKQALAKFGRNGIVSLDVAGSPNRILTFLFQSYLKILPHLFGSLYSSNSKTNWWSSCLGQQRYHSCSRSSRTVRDGPHLWTLWWYVA